MPRNAPPPRPEKPRSEGPIPGGPDRRAAAAARGAVLRALGAAALTLGLGLALGAAGGAGPAAAQTPLSGVWLSDKGKVAIEMHDCGPRLCGRIYWLAPRKSGKTAPRLDDDNPDPALRDRPLCGMEVLTGLRRQEDGSWTGGDLYYPKHGRSYSVQLTPEGPETVKMRAYLGLPLFGKTETWRPAPESLERCVPGEGAGSASASASAS